MGIPPVLILAAALGAVGFITLGIFYSGRKSQPATEYDFPEVPRGLSFNETDERQDSVSSFVGNGGKRQPKRKKSKRKYSKKV